MHSRSRSPPAATDNGRLQGWVEGDFVFVGPDEAGRVETLAVREGDQVAAGAPLFAVEADLQQADVRTTAAQVSEARARLARLEAAQQRQEEIAVLEAQEQRAQAMLALSTSELERQQSLSARGVAAQAQLDQAKANFSRDKAALEEVRRQIAVARLSAREEDIAGARQTLAAAQARQTSAETKLARRKLSSPVSGAVQQIYYRPGEAVPAGRPVLSILPPGNIKLRFFVAQALLPKIALGDAVEVTLRRVCAADRARELHLGLGRIHAAGDLQPRRAPQARVHDRGAAGKTGKPARRAAGAGRAQGWEAKK